MRQRLFEFIWLPMFERSSSGLLASDDKRGIEALLCANLVAGSLIRRTGGFRKFRYGVGGSGKRGGVRVIYWLDEVCERVYMILAYAKGRKETLTRSEENELRKLAMALKSEGC